MLNVFYICILFQSFLIISSIGDIKKLFKSVRAMLEDLHMISQRISALASAINQLEPIANMLDIHGLSRIIDFNKRRHLTPHLINTIFKDIIKSIFESIADFSLDKVLLIFLHLLLLIIVLSLYTRNSISPSIIFLFNQTFSIVN